MDLVIFDYSKIIIEVRFLIILFSILSLGLNAFCQEELLSGLYFSSHEVIPEKRTSLNLTFDKPYKFSDGFSVEMEANFRRGDGHYGYIFRIIGDENTNIDLVSHLASPSSNFWLVVKDKVVFSYKWADVPNGLFDQWLKIRIDIDIRNSKLSLNFNGNKQEARISEIKGIRNYNMVFGACRNPSFLNTDVSPMTLKNVRIFDAKNNLTKFWKLSKHGQNKVYDEIKQEAAVVENPVWSIDKHFKWRKLKEFKIDRIQGISEDENNGKIYIVGNHSVYIYSTQTLAIDTIPFAGGLPFFTLKKQIIYNKFTNELWSYDFNQNKINKFSFLTHQWSLNDTKIIDSQFGHHNSMISPVDSSLVTLFGYGHYLYKSLINRYDPKSQNWGQTDRSDQIQPRYLSGTGFLNNQELLVFGGYGSKSGRQELSPEFYYDLYSMNLKDFSFKKRWTLESPASPFVPCEALITETSANGFYTLIYNKNNYETFLHLARFEIAKNDYQLYNDSIPYHFLDAKSWSTLFLDQKTSQLITITSYNSEVSLYARAYPPLLPGDVYQVSPAKAKWYIWLIVFILTAGIILGAYVFVLNKKKVQEKDGLYRSVEHPNIISIEPIDRETNSSILLMGGFQIFDHNGIDISSNFSPTLKHLFLLIFCQSIKNMKGVSSARLDEVLWNDKLGESARNNRNVNMSKLRSILDEMKGVDIINENCFWKIKTDQTIYCDYILILQLLQKAKSTNITEPEIHKLIALLSFGEFLPQIQTDWMDGFKSQFANDTIDGLSSLFHKNEVINNLSLLYHLAECILVYDPLNDEAFAMKCSVLYRLGKKGMAKNLYDAFCKDYKQVLGIDYTVTFNESIK